MELQGASLLQPKCSLGQICHLLVDWLGSVTCCMCLFSIQFLQVQCWQQIYIEVSPQDCLKCLASVDLMSTIALSLGGDSMMSGIFQSCLMVMVKE